MARELIQKDIDGKHYEFEQFTATVALKTLAKLTKILGEPMAIALGGFIKDDKPGATKKPGILDREVNSDVMAKAVKALIERLDEDEVVILVKQLTSTGVLCDNVKINFDEHFRGEMAHLFSVVAVALEAQYGNFIGAITDRIPTVKTAQSSQGIVRA